jgi:hypothetical protein
MKEKRKSKNQSPNKRFVIIAGILLLMLVFGVSTILFYLFEPCCSEYQWTQTAITIEDPFPNLQLAATETQSAIDLQLTMTAEAP